MLRLTPDHGNRSHGRRIVAILLAAAAGIAGVAATTVIWRIDALVKSARSGPEHTFLLEEPPPFLTEAIAIAKAQETLRIDGLGQSVWHAVKDGRSKAPDGREDEFLVRNTQNANEGAIQFLSDNNRVRIVYVELRGNAIHARAWLPK